MPIFRNCAFAALLAFAATVPGPLAAQEEVHPVPGVLGGFIPPDGSRGGEVGFLVGGEFAAIMFDLMTSPVTEDICTGGTMRQDVSGLQCARDPDGTTQCSFGYDFQHQRLTAGPLVC